MPRNYRKEYDRYQGRPDQIKKRAMRNKARKLMEKKHGKAKLKGKDVDHKRGVSAGNSPSNLRVISASDNRSFPRDRRARKK